MFNTTQALLCKFINCQAEAQNFVKQSSDPALIASIYRGQNLQMICSSPGFSCDSFKFFDWNNPFILQFYKGIDLDQFAPRYQLEVLRNLYSLRDKIDHDLQELEPVMDEYMSFVSAEQLDSSQLKFKLRAEQQILDFWLLYRKVASVVGGFLMLEHFDDCLPIMIKKYHYCHKRFALATKISHLNDRLLKYYGSEYPTTSSNTYAKKIEAKVDLIQSQIKQLDRQILEIDHRLNDLRDFYANDASFCMHEKYRESALCLNYLTRSERKTIAADIVLITPDEVVKAGNSKTDFTSVLAELTDGTKQIMQQVEIQNLYELLAEFVSAANCKAQSCLFSPFLLTFENRNKFGLNLLKRRPKLLIWQGVSTYMQNKGLTADWHTFLKVLSEHEQISNCIIDDHVVSKSADFMQVNCEIVDGSLLRAKILENISPASSLSGVELATELEPMLEASLTRAEDFAHDLSTKSDSDAPERNIIENTDDRTKTD